jgi:hypothetical protein
MSLLGAGTVYSDMEMREAHCKKRVLELNPAIGLWAAWALCYDLDFRATFCNRERKLGVELQFRCS